jgi:hypothetical protein
MFGTAVVVLSTAPRRLEATASAPKAIGRPTGVVFWSSLLYGTVNMYLVVPFLVAFDPSYDNNRGDVIWSLAIAYVLWPTLVIWNLWRWQPGGRFHEAWLREHGIRPKAVRWPRRRRPASVIPR